MELSGYFTALLLLLLATVNIIVAATSDEFYTLLDIDRSATTKDIRKAFKKVALKMHPDKNTVSVTLLEIIDCVLEMLYYFKFFKDINYKIYYLLYLYLIKTMIV